METGMSKIDEKRLDEIEARTRDDFAVSIELDELLRLARLGLKLEKIMKENPNGIFDDSENLIPWPCAALPKQGDSK